MDIKAESARNGASKRVEDDEGPWQRTGERALKQCSFRKMNILVFDWYIDVNPSKKFYKC